MVRQKHSRQEVDNPEAITAQDRKSRLLSDLLPILIGGHSDNLLEAPAEIAFVAHAYQLME